MTDTKNSADPASQDGSEKNTDEKKGTDPQDQDGAEENEAYENQKKRAEKAESKVEELKAALAEKEDEKKGTEQEGDDATDDEVEEIAERLGIDPEAAKKFAEATTAKARKEAQAAIDAEFSRRDLSQAFDAAFEKSAKAYEEQEISKDAVKELYFNRRKDNEDLTVSDVIQEMYGTPEGYETSEDDVKGGGEGGETIDFEEARKDPEKIAKIMSDPETKRKYYDWRNEQGI